MIQRIVSATGTTVPYRLYQLATVQKVQRLILGSQLCVLDTSSPSPTCHANSDYLPACTRTDHFTQSVIMLLQK